MNETVISTNAAKEEETFFLKKRQVKLASKMHQILHLYAIDRLKPREISKLLDIAPSKVYDTVYHAKKAADNLKEPKPIAKPKVKNTLANNKQLLDAMQRFLTERGIYNFTAQQMKTYLAEQKQQHPEQHQFRVPCCKSL